jgi:hypothetical protein
MVAVKEREKVKKTDLQIRMEKMQEWGALNEHHKLLGKLAGRWKTSFKNWMEPGKPPVENTGTSEQEMILGGHYLQQKEIGLMMGVPFSGLSLVGYDNRTKKYFQTWIDSSSTGVQIYEGAASHDGKTIKMESCFDDPVKGPVTSRIVTKLVDDNTYTFEMFMVDKHGKEDKMMEITYNRA